MINLRYHTYKLSICTAIIFYIITVLSDQVVNGQAVNFDILDPVSGSGCRPLTVSFQNNSDAANTRNFIWDFGDGDTSGLQEPVHNYQDTGRYSITLVYLS